MRFSSSFVFQSLLLLGFSIQQAYSHGYLKSPRSRNSYAKEEGLTWGSVAGKPPKEYCQQCLNTNSGVCGASPTTDYDLWLDMTSNQMPWESQATFEAGETIVVDIVLTAHHGGHFELRGCPLGRASDQACFDEPGHTFMFVKDVLHDMPADPNYPERGYCKGGQASSIKDFSMEFKIPKGLVGEQVLLQWKYITANSCSPPGYSDYFSRNNLPDSDWSPAVSGCQLPYPQDGSTSSTWPEQFWNCAEVTINDSVTPSQPTPLPTSPPTRLQQTQPSKQPVVTPPAPTKAPTGDQIINGDGEHNRLIAYLGNWLSCPTPEQLEQYTHVMIGFAVSYTWNAWKNNCDQTCHIDTPPICNGPSSSTLVADLHAAGKKVILSFGGAGMGGSWSGDNNDCWDYCFGREDQVVDRLVEIVEDLDLDGIDIDYEYFYENGQNGSGFNKGAEAQNFLKKTTLGLREKLPEGSLVTHAPMDSDMVPGKAYYEILEEIGWSLDFLMPQYYNGITRPVIDGLGSGQSGRVATIDHYRALVDNVFEGDASKMVFGFCIQGCGGTNSNANAVQAANIITELAASYSCNGGAFFWMVEDDIGGAWSKAVSQAFPPSDNCTPTTGAPIGAPTSTPTILQQTQPSKQPVVTPPAPTKAPTSAPIDTPVKTPTSLPTPTGQQTTSAPTHAPSRPSSSTPAPTGDHVVSTLAPTGVPGSLSCPRSYTGLMAVDSCTGFRYCTDGSFSSEKLNCPPGTLFDETIQTCNYDYSVWCNGVPPPGVPLCPSGYSGWMAVDSCSGYRYCTNGKVTSSHYKCGDGLLFDVSIASCNWSNQVTCSTESTLTPTSAPFQPTLAPTKKSSCTCAPTTHPTGTVTSDPTSHPTNSPTDHPTLVPTNAPTLLPTDPKPDEQECAACMGFLSNYDDADDSKAAEKQCKVISSVKDVQKACKKVVKDVLKKGKDRIASCKTYGWCPASRTRARRTTECVCEEEPTNSPTNGPTRITASEPTTNPTSDPTNSPMGQQTLAPTIKNPPTCAPTSNPTGTLTLKPTSNPTNRPTKDPTLVPTNTPTLVPTDPKPDEQECAACMGFLSNYDDADDSKAAEKQCKVISSVKDVQKACKKVVKDVLKKGKDRIASCKTYGWCPASRRRAFLRARRTAECEEGPTSSPVVQPTKAPASPPTIAPTKNTPAPTIIQETPPTKSPTANPTVNPTNSPTEHPTLVPTDPKPDEEECAVCMNFLSNHEDADDSKAAEKECKTLSTDKVVQKACKKVVKDVLKKGKDKLDSCKVYGWCS